MMRKFYAFLILLSIAYSGSLFAQSGAGELRGKVQDAKTKEGIPFAAVIVESNGSQVAAQQTDFDGNFVIKPILPGKYDVRVKIIGYNERVISGVIITTNKQTYVNPDLSANVRNIQEVTVSDYAKPLIEKDNTTAGGSLNSDEIKKLPTRNINSLVSTTAGVYQADEGAALSVKGSRSDANDYYIDGVKVRGTTNLPQGAIEQINVITGGVPAQYGDATGGIVTITTKGPSKKFNGSVEAATSEFLDGYGYNLVSGILSGPILIKNKGTESERSLIGFFASAELETKRDQNPSYVGAYKAKSDYLANLKKNPGKYIIESREENGDTLFNIKRVPTANFSTTSDLDKVKAQDDNENRNLNFSLRLDYQPNLNNTFALGFSGSNQRQRVYSRANMLFNSENNAVLNRNNYRIFGRYTQKFNQSTDESKALLKNAYYTVQADFSRDYIIQQDINHKDQFFNYGHIGTYKTDKKDIIGIMTTNGKRDTLLGSDGKLYTLSNADFTTSGGKRDTAYTFSSANSSNPDIAVYNDNLNAFLAGNSDLFPNYVSNTGFQGYTGILNGGGPQTVFGGLFNSPGTVSNVYDIQNRDQYRVSAMASADFKGHAIQVGIEYEQRIESRFRLNPRGLWTQMRAQQNSYIRLDETGIDWANKTIDVTGSNVTLVNDNTFLLSTKTEFSSAATQFAKSIRAKLGKGAGEFVDIDSYDPDMFSIDMFDASNLIDNLNPSGLAYTYFGYTYDGKKSTKNYTMEDFLLDPMNRPVGAFRPIYTAGYIQDKFTYKDIVFNLGIRVDRFDANQQVLKDKYSLFETRTAGELPSNFTRPSNIPASAVVYVDEAGASIPTAVRGYRVGDVFYDASGNVVQDYLEVKSLTNGRATPWLVSSAVDSLKNGKLTNGAFKDYEPQTQIMPRIAFSFPISDEANFFANYDVLTQRPRTNVYANPIVYYLQYLQKQSQIIVSPDIKPEKTINYQFGFKQRLGQTSALTLTAFYKELKDNFQQVQIANAYPASYLTYANRDFGTIKGFTMQYDLRRTNNVQINASYTLQFANGTGSNTNSAANLISSGESEPIRVAIPLDYDQRHTIVTTIDYRYGSGASYTGPVALKSVLENFGINFIVRAGSGTPYSRISLEKVQDLLSADDTRFRRLIGEINGSRLPWQYNMDLRVDKDIMITSKGTDGKGRETSLNVYVLVQNLLDARRVGSVYPATGLPDDDGYLSSTQASNYLDNLGNDGAVQSYMDLYKISMNDPGNFRLPRVIRVGAIYNF